MKDTVGRLIIFSMVLCVSAYAVFLLLGSSIHAEAIDTTHIVNIRDVLQPGVHHLSGMVMVSRTCSELLVDTEPLSSSTHKLIFRTWDEPAVPCLEDDTPRPFRAVVFAPAAGVEFIATLDGKPLTTVIYQEKALP